MSPRLCWVLGVLDGLTSQIPLSHNAILSVSIVALAVRGRYAHSHTHDLALWALAANVAQFIDFLDIVLGQTITGLNSSWSTRSEFLTTPANWHGCGGDYWSGKGTAYSCCTLCHRRSCSGFSASHDAEVGDLHGHEGGLRCESEVNHVGSRLLLLADEASSGIQCTFVFDASSLRAIHDLVVNSAHHTHLYLLYHWWSGQASECQSQVGIASQSGEN